MAIQYQIIRRLSDGHFHSGQLLADEFGVTRAAIWKQLSQFRKDTGLEVYSVKGKGYKLENPLELLDRRVIIIQLSVSSKNLISELEIHDQIDSTNNYLMEKARTGIATGHVCLAEQQVSGKGRRGRSWISPFGSNIYMSIYWRYALDLAELSGLSLASGLAVARALEAEGLQGIGLKWPNDVVWNRQKLAGMLLEVVGEQGGPSRVVLGLGLNTGMTMGQAAAIDQPWVDLNRIPGGKEISRNRLVAKLLNTLTDTLCQFDGAGNLSLVDDWKQYDVHYGKRVILKIGSRSIEGFHRGIDNSGAIQIQIGNKIESFHGGEISLREYS